MEKKGWHNLDKGRSWKKEGKAEFEEKKGRHNLKKGKTEVEKRRKEDLIWEQEKKAEFEKKGSWNLEN